MTPPETSSTTGVDIEAAFDDAFKACSYESALALYEKLPERAKRQEGRMMYAVASAFRLRRHLCAKQILRSYARSAAQRNADALLSAFVCLEKGLHGKVIESIRTLLAGGSVIFAQALFQELALAEPAENVLVEMLSLGSAMLDTPLAPHNVLLDISSILVQLNDFAGAENAFECAVKLNKEMVYWSLMTSIGFLKQYRKVDGKPLARRASNPDVDKISVSSLAYYGRFAHTLGNYIAARLYADRHSLELQTPDWPGGLFFGLDDPLISTRYEACRDASVLAKSIDARFENDDGKVIKNVDLFSPYSNPFASEFKDRVQAMFRVDPTYEKYVEPPLTRLRSRRKPLVACHIRRGDMLWDNHAAEYRPPDLVLYRRFVEELRREIGDFTLYVATDSKQDCLQELGEHGPLFLEDVGEPWHGLRFLQDFYIMMQCDRAVISVGSFGLIACALNRNATHFYRPDEERARIVPFQPWP